MILIRHFENLQITNFYTCDKSIALQRRVGKWREISSALVGSDCPASRSDRFSPGIHGIGVWVGPRASLDVQAKRKFSAVADDRTSVFHSTRKPSSNAVRPPALGMRRLQSLFRAVGSLFDIIKISTVFQHDRLCPQYRFKTAWSHRGLVGTELPFKWTPCNHISEAGNQSTLEIGRLGGGWKVSSGPEVL